MKFNKNKQLKFLDKRDKDNLIIKYSAIQKASEIADHLIQKNLNKTNSIRRLLDSHFNSKLLDLYFSKLLINEFECNGIENLSNKIIIQAYDNKNNKKINTIFLDSFLNQNIKDDINSYFRNVELKYKFFSYISIFIKEIRKLLFCYFLSILFYFYQLYLKLNKKHFTNKKIISFNYNLGLIENSKSDIFWIPDTNNEKCGYSFFFENRKLRSAYIKNKKELSVAKKLNIDLIDDLNLLFTNNIFKKIKLPILLNSNFRKLYEKIYKSEDFKKLNQYFKKEIYIFIQQISFWIEFFKKNNIVMHHDSNINGVNPVIKAIALDYLNGVSFNCARSYPREGIGMHNGWYPNDILFVYGNDSKNKIMKTHNINSNVIISGYPYPISNKKVFQLNKIIPKKSYKILILDNLFSENTNSETQLIYRYNYENFYNSILSLSNKFEDIFFIIKPKKIEKLLDNKLISKKINSLKTKITIIEDAEIDPIHLSQISDFIFSTGIFLSGALMEALNNKLRGVYYDYANTKKIENNLYKWGENKVIFNDLNKMIREFEKYKTNMADKSHLGNWKEQYEYYVYTKNGQEFVKLYINKLFNNLLLFNKQKSIKYTNDYFNINY